MKRVFLLLLMFLLFLPGLGGCSAVRESFTEEYPLQGATKLVVSARNCSVKVTGWNEDYVRLRIIWMAHGETESVREYGEKIQVTPEWEGNELKFTVSYPPWSSLLNSFSISLELEAPRERIEEVMVETSNGALGFYSLHATLTGRSNNGRITVEDCVGEIDLETTNGQVVLNNLQFRGEKGRVVSTNGRIEADVMFPRTGSFLLRTTNGSVDLKLPSWTQGTVRMETSNGNIFVDHMPAVQLLRPGKDFMEVQFHGSGMYLDVKTSNDNIRLGESELLYPSATGI